MRNRMYGGVRGRKTKVGEKLLCFPPTRFQQAVDKGGWQVVGNSWKKEVGSFIKSSYICR